MKNRVYTPWGYADNEHVIADGIVEYSTPSHGGIHLSPARQKTLKSIFPNFHTFAGGSWYEEDCDVAVVMLAFPSYFSAEAVFQAVRMAKSLADHGDDNNWKSVADALKRPEFKAIMAKANSFEQSVEGQWETGGMASSEGHKWLVYFTQAGTGAKRTALMSYPEKRYYTTAELDNIETVKS